MKRSPFDTLHFHGKVYEIFTGRVINTHAMSNNARVAYNSRVAQAKQSYGITSEDVKHLILFAFAHNPLALPDIADYGEIGTVLRCTKYFVKWWTTFHKETDETSESVTKLIWKTRPSTAFVEDSYAKEIEEAFKI